MDALSEARLAQVHPKLAALVRKMADQLAEENINIRVVQGFRSYEQQADLYADGRDANGNVVDKSKVVTNAKPGTSWHNYGLAVDVAPFDAGIPDWNASHPAWKRIVEAGESAGLISGSIWRTFPDWPHFQLAELPISPSADDAIALNSEGIDAVWARKVGAWT
jgi:peptidoglycan LD-endopeptidase CwlK